MLDYVTVQYPALGLLQINPQADINADGVEDFQIIYPDGHMQYLFGRYLTRCYYLLFAIFSYRFIPIFSSHMTLSLKKP